MATCKQCGEVFIIDSRDRDFYAQISPTFNGRKFLIPEPKLCALCRMQRRYSYRGELHLFYRKCASSGANILTFYPPSSDCVVYRNEDWWSDKWDPLTYGRDFDFSRPFFDQFAELLKEVPLIARTVQGEEQNSEFTNCASWNRNCYLIAGANYNEDCYYGNYINRSKNCVDCNFVTSCELCYECVDCTNCYDLKYSENSHNCSDSAFLFSCRACQNCFGCVNLVAKQYHFFNQPLTKDEYAKRLKELDLSSRSGVKRVAELCKSHRLKYPRKFMIGELNENVTGNALHSCHNTFDCFDGTDLWDCRYCSWMHQSKNCMDIHSWGFPAELCYECVEAGNHSYRSLFCVSSFGGQDLFYCFLGMFSKNCFGCVSLRRNEYCIFNKQYSPAEYEQTVAKIISHMQNTGEWGEFFPIGISPLCYNTSIAQDYFPLEREAVIASGWKWEDAESKRLPPSEGVNVPDNIADVADDICKEILVCEELGKPFKITSQELLFYRRNRIPVPTKCFNARHRSRLGRRTPRNLWDRNCAKCNAAIRTSYPPSAPEKIYCGACYSEEIS